MADIRTCSTSDSMPEQLELTLFQKLGAPSDLCEWATWYAEHRRSRGIPKEGLLPELALQLTVDLDGAVISDDRYDMVVHDWMIERAVSEGAFCEYDA